MAKKPFQIPKLTTYEDILGISPEDNAKEEIVYIPYQYLRRSPYQYRDKGLTKEQIQEQVESLAFDIEVDGKIQQPCIVRERVPAKANCYEIVAGHHRILAAEYLTEVKGVEGIGAATGIGIMWKVFFDGGITYLVQLLMTLT